MLIVDDVAENASALAHVLELLGAEVRVACTATDALSHAENERFDAFVCDIVMRDMDGCRLLAALRATPINSGTPAIAHTGHNDPDVHDAALAAGYARVLTKPTGMEAFADAILALCER